MTMPRVASRRALRSPGAKRSRRHSMAPFQTVCTRLASAPISWPSAGSPVSTAACQFAKRSAQRFADGAVGGGGVLIARDACAVWRIHAQQSRRGIRWPRSRGRASAISRCSNTQVAADAGTARIGLRGGDGRAVAIRAADDHGHLLLHARLAAATISFHSAASWPRQPWKPQ